MICTQIVYGIDGGKLALMNHQTVSKAFAPLPAGSAAVYTGTTLAWYRHPDWLGSSSVTSLPSGTDRRSRDVSYSPFGDIAAENGPGTADRNFTGQNQDLTSILYDFPAREYSQGEGRWISPDPAGIAAVDPGNPQSWNRYAYVNNNPLSLIDPTGMDPTQQDSVVRVVEVNGCLYLQNGTRTVWLNPDNETTSYTYLWGGMSVLTCKTSGTGPHGPGGGGTDPGAATLKKIAKAACGALPSGTVVSISGNGNYVGLSGALDLVTNLRTGEVTGFFSPGYFAGNASAGGSLTGGYTFGNLGSGNSNFTGGFTGVSGGYGYIGGSVSTSSGGPASPLSGINPMAPGHVTTVSVGVQTPGRSLLLSTTYSLPTALGKYWTLLDPATAFMYVANKLCEAAGH